ncbi:little elongation complex subunit 2 [Drosophila pseudoobscura]|uniref:Little elongation complex subunit 2 n=1 Tax=Drosophila pseudoobscura pseudoobscura TaxID=46245 RepID=A0A6I8US75_DROPS|nr:little elongation complex subunit 2 [Drosophila pseudoobscura]
MEPGMYQGDPIFRNQPSYKVFNKSFEHVDDTLYTCLNEVIPEVLSQELEGPSEVFTSYSNDSAPKDPRTQQTANKSVRDHSRRLLPYKLTNLREKYSALTSHQQTACMRVLLAWQRNDPVPEDDFVVWRVTEKKRHTEYQMFQKDVLDYETSQRELLYAPMKSIVQAYRIWHELRMKQLLKGVPNDTYVTYSGLPQLAQCNSLNPQTASVEEVQLKRIVGQVRLWPEAKLKRDELMTLNVRLCRFSGIETVYPTIPMLEQPDEGNIFVLPLESLMMLLSTGAYVDLPTEMLVTVKETYGSEHKCFEFKDPFPARNCGWHTSGLLLTQAYQAYRAQSGEDQWLTFDQNGSLKDVPDLPSFKELAVDLQMDYKLQPVDIESAAIEPSNSNTAMISWCLRSQGDDDAEPSEEFQMYSSLSLAGVSDAEGAEPLGCHFIKLENKPDCGCEIMSKYELLKAWLHLKLLKAEIGHCSRVSLRDFEPLLEEKLTLVSLEKMLHDYYNTSMPQLLSHLCEFLKLFNAIPPGDYLLRNSVKYKDKFLLCKPIKEPTPPPQSFKLHELLTATAPSDECFLSQNSYLPISNTLCGRLHEEQQLLPCAFPIKTSGIAVKRRNKVPVEEPRRQPINRRVAAHREAQRKKAKKSQKMRAKARKKQTAKKEDENEKEMDKFMSL